MASPPFNINQAIPGDTDIVSQHPANARTFRDIVESWLLINHNDLGQHHRVELASQADPTASAGVGVLWQNAGVLKYRTASDAIDFTMDLGKLTMLPTTAVGLTLDRTGAAVNSAAEFKTTSGSVFAGQGAANTFAVKNASDLDTSPWMTLSASGMTLAVALALTQGGTGATTAAGARTNLGLGALAVKSTVATADIDDDAVTFAKFQNVTAPVVIGRNTAGTGDVEAMAPATVKTLLGYPTSSTNNAVPKFSGTSGNFIDTGVIIGGSNELRAGAGSLSSPSLSFAGDTDTGFYNYGPGDIGITMNGVYRGRFGNGDLYIHADAGATGPDTASVASGAGVGIYNAGFLGVGGTGGSVAGFNRINADGSIVNINQDGNVEGQISVSGTTVTYGSFCGSHWSQLPDDSHPEILRGTVVETLDEMCVWPGETNIHLVRFKISNTPASERVYGIFLSWDEDGDALIASLGAYLIRVQAGQTVKGGDLLESAGDGCARVQSDKVIRASTIGKVSSHTPAQIYPDGSFTVPAVLYCG